MRWAVVVMLVAAFFAGDARADEAPVSAKCELRVIHALKEGSGIDPRITRLRPYLEHAPFTAWQTRTWLVQIVEAQIEISLLGHVAIVTVAIVGGIIAAVFGEMLLFGSRRRER